MEESWNDISEQQKNTFNTLNCVKCVAMVPIDGLNKLEKGSTEQETRKKQFGKEKNSKN